MGLGVSPKTRFLHCGVGFVGRRRQFRPWGGHFPALIPSKWKISDTRTRPVAKSGPGGPGGDAREPPAKLRRSETELCAQPRRLDRERETL